MCPAHAQAVLLQVPRRGGRTEQDALSKSRGRVRTRFPLSDYAPGYAMPADGEFFREESEWCHSPGDDDA